MDNLVIQQIDDKLTYCRSQSNQQLQLEQSLSAEYQTSQNSIHTMITPSGTSAIRLAIEKLVKSSKNEQVINLFYGDELYSQTPGIFKYLSTLYKFNYYSFDVNDSEKIKSLITQHNKDKNIIFIESATNPSGDIFDFELIYQLRSICKTLTVVVDNTWLTCKIFNPFMYKVDVVVVSLTKYYSGGSYNRNEEIYR
jgi:cystathionine beta-lyase/cystathionine gamma-synthase